MSLNPGLMSSASEDWATPQAFFDSLNAEFNFTLDVCASPKNAKCERYIDRHRDALTEDWAGETCWMNPPYGRTIGNWVRHAWGEVVLRDATVVCLLPARTDTRWWSIFWNHDEHRMRRAGDEVRFVKGRLKFNSAGPAPFPSAVVILRG